MPFSRHALALALAGLALAAPAARAATLEPIGDFEEPVYVTSAPDEPESLYVVERRGMIELTRQGAVSTFADLTSLVDCPSGCTGERGLMSVALAPDFEQSGHLYVDYIQNETGEIHVDELTASGGEAPLSSLRPLLTIPHPGESNHNGGQLQLGPEGLLYISTGDGGGSNDQHHNSQNPQSLLGKILRIDPAESEPTPIVWSLGLRNPFRFSFDPVSHDMVIGDVGQEAREEVDLAPAGPLGQIGGEGANYGWNCREGFIAGPGDDLPGEQCETTSFVEPVFDYPHTDPGGEKAHGCAIIGGYVVRDRSLGSLYGRYIYTDLCVGEIRSLLLPSQLGEKATDDRPEGLSVSSPVSFGEDSCRRLYVVSIEGEVSRLVGPEPAVCTPLPREVEEREREEEKAKAGPASQAPPELHAGRRRGAGPGARGATRRDRRRGAGPRWPRQAHRPGHAV